MTRPVVLVTGATRGIGAAVCDALADDHDLVVGGTNADAVAAVCNRYPSARPFTADLTDASAVERAVDELGLERLDGLVHSAGLLGSGAFRDLTRDDWRRTFEVNVFAVADLTRLLLPALEAAPGTVVVINSGSGLTANGPGGVYSASKFAARALTDAMREELRPAGIRVSSVHPGRVATDMQVELNEFEGREYDAENYLRPESVASAVRAALTATPDANFDMVSVRPGPAASNRS
ncbi:short-chain dehydrogenase [Dermacoccus sp. PE3]|uniref:SDR family oxidoreductase n=1 Tax=Dermacoccus sp. PE3 TaxID=1641401 RepID=UPI0006427232|nr:SDR family oxidoreductase [Dermacoccus sp. PE3]KLO62956.1 short-chain dehydrogenase [Dermacoccus sp. PE3]